MRTTKDGDDSTGQTLLPWFGIAAKHIRHDVPHDMKSIRASITKGRANEWSERERLMRKVLPPFTNRSRHHGVASQ